MIFRQRWKELNEYFLMLKQEIMQVRVIWRLIKHRFFQRVNIFKICDEATGLAEAYSQPKGIIIISI